MYNAKLAAQMRREQLLTMRSDKKVKAVNDMDVLNTTYKENKEWICAGCAIEIEPNKQSKCPNVFTGLTKKGKSLKDFLTSIIKENLDESMIGHKLCPSCYDALNHIEDLYASFRISADIFLDKFLLGQKALEADLVGLQQINDLTHLPGCLNLPLNKIIIKVCTTIFFNLSRWTTWTVKLVLNLMLSTLFFINFPVFDPLFIYEMVYNTIF